MFSIVGDDGPGWEQRPSRRELLRVGGLSLLGLSLGELTGLRSGAAAPEGLASRHRTNSCVFIFLFGGPSHIDLWDMKPSAPAEIRGEFRPIATRVPGLHLCEHLPLMAARADQFCLIRSMTHHMPVHGPACSELYTGRPYFAAPTTDQERPEDWPSVASMVTRYGPKRGGWPPSVVLPWFTQFAGQDRPIAGQIGGRMGRSFRPFLIGGDPSRPDFDMPGLRLPKDVPLRRAEARRALLRQLEAADAARPLFRSSGPGRTGIRRPFHDRVRDAQRRTRGRGARALARATVRPRAVRRHQIRARACCSPAA